MCLGMVTKRILVSPSSHDSRHFSDTSHSPLLWGWDRCERFFFMFPAKRLRASLQIPCIVGHAASRPMSRAFCVETYFRAWPQSPKGLILQNLDALKGRAFRRCLWNLHLTLRESHNPRVFLALAFQLPCLDAQLRAWPESPLHSFVYISRHLRLVEWLPLRCCVRMLKTLRRA